MSKIATYMSYLLALLLVYDTMCRVYSCRSSYTTQRGVGQKCMPSSNAYINLTDTTKELCLWHCLRDQDCIILNYNYVSEYCVLINDSCESVIADDQFVLHVFVTDRTRCISWEATSDPFTVPQDYVGFLQAPGSTYIIAVVRIVRESDTLPGKMYIDNGNVFAVLDGSAITPTAEDVTEILTIAPSCLTAWVPYDATTGENLPSGAVVGGELSSGTVLYVARVYNALWYDVGGWATGYYNPNAGLAYVEHYGQATDHLMDILILL